MSIHSGALMAAQAANCAAERGQYHEMRLRLFEGVRNNEWRDGSIQALDLFTQYGTDMGFNETEYAQCIASNRYLDQVRLDMQQAEQLGIRSTPSFVINGRLLLGAQPFSEFKRIIDYNISPP
jgi:protein-disulfide isomerase